MKHVWIGAVLSMAMIACTDQQQSKAVIAPDIAAGKSIVEASCVGCHGVDGISAAPGIPHLAAQSDEYLQASLKAYKEGNRLHRALRDMTATMTEADMRNVAGYFASQPPAKTMTSAPTFQSPYDKGKAKAEACASCHGEYGNSVIAGTPSLAGQQPIYFISAVRAYLDGRRHIKTMEAMLRGISKVDMENMAVYFAAQTPTRRQATGSGDPALGEPLTAKCGGCHGARGISHDAATPSLAGQDAQYLVTAMKAYHDGTREHNDMVRLLSDTSDSTLTNIAAFYSVQVPEAADKRPLSVSELAANCDRCHGPGISNPTVAIPKISGQDRDYLVMALRAYRDGKRVSSTMHKMSLPYSDTVIESVASWYANQPAR